MFKKIILLTPFLVSCSSFNPQPGMTFEQVNRNAYAPCPGSQKINDTHVHFIGKHPVLDNVDVYMTTSLIKLAKYAPPECMKRLYFIDGKYMADNTIYEMISVKQREKDLIAEQDRKREFFHNGMMEIVKNKNLELVDYFKLPDRNYFKDKYDFKIYKDINGNLFYLKDFLFVTKDKVTDELAIYEKDIDNIRIVDEKRIEKQRIAEQQRLEKIRLDNIEYANALKKIEADHLVRLELTKRRINEENAKNDLIYGKVGVAVRVHDLVVERTCIRERRDTSFQGQLFGFTTCTEYMNTGNLIVNISLRNNTSTRVKDPYISCGHYTKTDTYITGIFSKSGDYVYEFLNQNEVVNSKIIITNHERSAAIKCQVKSYTNANK
jgi:hypothetical protein